MNLFLTKIAYAAPSKNLDQFIANVDSMIINPLIVFLFALALLFFLYGEVEFFLNQTNEEKKTTGKQHMMWGIIGIAIMMGVWTILGIILNTLGISEVRIDPNGDTKITLPPPK